MNLAISKRSSDSLLDSEPSTNEPICMTRATTGPSSHKINEPVQKTAEVK